MPSAQSTRPGRVEFVPLACETWGAWHPEALRAIKKLAKQMACHVGKDEATTTRHVLQRLAVLLQRGNVALLTSRVPEHPAPEVDGDLDVFQKRKNIGKAKLTHSKQTNST